VAAFEVDTSEVESDCAQLSDRRGGMELDLLDAIELQPTSTTGNTSSSSSGDEHCALVVDSLPGRSADGSGGPVSVLDFRSRLHPVPQTPTLVAAGTLDGGETQLFLVVDGGTTAGCGVVGDLPNVRNVQVSRDRPTTSSTINEDRR